MRYSAMPMPVPFFHLPAESMALMTRYYYRDGVPESKLPEPVASNDLAFFVQRGLQYRQSKECYVFHHQP